MTKQEILSALAAMQADGDQAAAAYRSLDAVIADEIRQLTGLREITRQRITQHDERMARHAEIAKLIRDCVTTGDEWKSTS